VPTHWLKTLGRQGHALPTHWEPTLPGGVHVTYFPRRPRIARGDLVVYYAAGWQAIIAAGEVTSDGALPEPAPSNPKRGRGRYITVEHHRRALEALALSLRPA
jgi:hypothetical protein